MKFSIEVGEAEKHLIECDFNQLIGRALVRVDGRAVFQKQHWFSEPVVNSGDTQRHQNVHIRIERERELVFGSKYRIYVDDRLMQLYQGV
jgi:hypothetical protein